MAQKDMLSARERRLRRVALRKGLSLRKLRRGQDRDRYLLVDPDFEAPMASPDRGRGTARFSDEHLYQKLGLKCLMLTTRNLPWANARCPVRAPYEANPHVRCDER